MSSTSFGCDKDSTFDDDDTPPTQEDCCNSGCTPCVFDIYQERLEKKKKKDGGQCRYDLLSATKFKTFILLEKRDFGGCYCRLTFQPLESTSETATNLRESDDRIAEEKDCNNIIAKEKKGCNNIIAAKEDHNNIITANEKMECDNMIAAEKDHNIKADEKDGSDNIIKEQYIEGFLPYDPGQHLTMKSWKMTDLDDYQKMRKPETSDNPVACSSKNGTVFEGREDGNMKDYQIMPNLKDVRNEAGTLHDEGVCGSTHGTTSTYEDKEGGLKAQIDENFEVSPEMEMRASGAPDSITYSKEAIMGTTKPNFITRDYTPITLSQSSSNCCFQIIIKYYLDGVMSQYLKSLKIGDKVYFRGPYGDFKYLKNHDHMLAVCMGTGIAPIYTIFQSILDDEADETFLKLLYGCKDAESIVLHDELREMSKFWNFGAEIYLTSGSEGAKFGELFCVGRIQRQCIYKNLKQKQLVLICGNETFNSEIVGYLSEFNSWKIEYFVF